MTGPGDLVLTCTGPYSRNRHVGVELGKGRRIDDIIADMHMVAEGVKCAAAVIALARSHGIHMPIAQDVFEVIQGHKTAAQAFRGLIRTAGGSEADAG